MNIFYIILVLIAGLFFGGIFGWLIAKYKQAKDNLNISKEELNDNYISKELFNETKEENHQKEVQLIEINKELSSSMQDNKHLNEKLTNQKKGN